MRQTLLILAVALSVAIAILYVNRPLPTPGDPVLEDLRQQLFAASDNLVAIEVQRFLPPALGQPYDHYSNQLESLSNQIMWEARIGVGMAMWDLRTAITPDAYAQTHARVLAGSLRLQEVLAQVPVLEWNERAYVTEMQDILQQIQARLLGIPHRAKLPVRDAPGAGPAPTTPPS